jgi:hypothetical protein
MSTPDSDNLSIGAYLWGEGIAKCFPRTDATTLANLVACTSYHTIRNHRAPSQPPVKTFSSSPATGLSSLSGCQARTMSAEFWCNVRSHRVAVKMKEFATGSGVTAPETRTRVVFSSANGTMYSVDGRPEIIAETG